MEDCSSCDEYIEYIDEESSSDDDYSSVGPFVMRCNSLMNSWLKRDEFEKRDKERGQRYREKLERGETVETIADPATLKCSFADFSEHSKIQCNFVWLEPDFGIQNERLRVKSNKTTLLYNIIPPEGDKNKYQMRIHLDELIHVSATDNMDRLLSVSDWDCDLLNGIEEYTF